MLLQQIVEKLDAELDRLQRLRAIVDGLNGGPVLVAPLLATTREVHALPAVEEVKIQRLPPRMPRGERRVRRAKAEKAHSALMGAVPAGPVVVTRSALARENEAKKQAQPVAPKVVEGTLGAMIRALGPQRAN